MNPELELNNIEELKHRVNLSFTAVKLDADKIRAKRSFGDKNDIYLGVNFVSDSIHLDLLMQSLTILKNGLRASHILETGRNYLEDIASEVGRGNFTIIKREITDRGSLFYQAYDEKNKKLARHLFTLANTIPHKAHPVPFPIPPWDNPTVIRENEIRVNAGGSSN